MAMCKKKAGQPNGSAEKFHTALSEQSPATDNGSTEQLLPALVPDDPVSQLKLSLAKLAKHVEAMGLALGAPPRTMSPQLAAIIGTSASSEMVATASGSTDLSVQTATPRPGTGSPGPSAISSSRTNPYARPEMTQEEKRNKRNEKKEKKKDRVEAAKNKDKLNNIVPPTASSSTSVASSEIIHTNGFSKVETPGDERRVECLKNVPNFNKSPVKSAIKVTPHDEYDDRKVQFDFSNDAEVLDESMDVVENDWSVPIYTNSPVFHPSFAKLYIRCDSEIIYELDDLCVEFIEAFKEFFDEFMRKRLSNVNTEEKGPLGLDLKKALSVQIAFLTHDGRWPLPTALGTIVSQMKREMVKMVENKDDVIMKDWVAMIEINYFEAAYNSMANHLKDKLKRHDRLVLYNCNRAMEKVIMHCKDDKIAVCVVDDIWNGRGYKLVKRLSQSGFKHCEYTTIEGASRIMKQGSLTLIGGSAVLSNGNVYAPKGSSQLCVLSQYFNQPTMVLVQSFKFVDRIHINSCRIALLCREAEEVVTSDLITALVTDIRILPPSSAPAVLKAKALDCLET